MMKVENSIRIFLVLICTVMIGYYVCLFNGCYVKQTALAFYVSTGLMILSFVLGKIFPLWDVEEYIDDSRVVKIVAFTNSYKMQFYNITFLSTGLVIWSLTNSSISDITRIVGAVIVLIGSQRIAFPKKFVL